MIKEITISENQKIKLNASLGWVLRYRAQFGHDILPDLLPMLESGLVLVGGAMDESGELEWRKLLEFDTVSTAMISFAGAEFTTALNIIWAMAKNADESIPAPFDWVNQFENFPLDKIVPEVLDALISTVVSEKNRKRLGKLVKKNQPKASTRTASLSAQ